MNGDGANLVEVRAQGIRWLVPEKHRDRLLGHDGLRLQEWLHSGQARIVKHGPHRTVYRVALPELDFYLKHYRLMDARARIREFLRPAKARMEYERAVAVAQRQVPTVVPLGLGECPGPGESFLVTQSLLGVEALSSFLETTLPGFDALRQAKLRQRVARALGHFLARVHDAGIIHRDLHAGNLLVRLEESDWPAFYLVDLHDIRIRGTLSWRARRDNLVLLNRWFILRASRSDRLRFFRAYESTVSVSRSETSTDSERPRQLEHQTWASNLTFWRHRDRRCLVTNRYYERVRSCAARGHAVRDLDRATLNDLLQNPDAPFLRSDVNWLKDSPSSSVIEWEIPHGGAISRVIYKRFKVVARSDPLAALVRRTPALRSWIFGHGLRDRCLPTPRPLLILHRKRFGLAHEGYLLTEKVDDAVELHRAGADLAELQTATRLHVLRARIDRAARLVRELHRRNLSHRDLKAANILVQRSRDIGSTTIAADEGMWLIDLVGVRRHWRLLRQRRVQNLSRLHASFHRCPLLTRTDKLRFLRAYFQWGLLGRNDWKAWWRQIDQATLVKIDRNRRSGRALS